MCRMASESLLFLIALLTASSQLGNQIGVQGAECPTAPLSLLSVHYSEDYFDIILKDKATVAREFLAVSMTAVRDISDSPVPGMQPPIQQHLIVPIDCLGHVESMYNLSSSQLMACAKQHLEPACTDYSISITPTLSFNSSAGNSECQLEFKNQPKPPQIQNIKPDSNSVRITWQDDAGCSQITSHWLAVTSGSPRSTYELADCVQDIAGFSSVNTSQCLPQLQLSPCTGYQFQILAEIDGTSTLRSDPVNVTTLPSPMISAVIESIGADDRSISVGLALSDEACLLSMATFSLNILDGIREQSVVAFSTGKLTTFNSSSAHLPIERCTEYSIEATPHFDGNVVGRKDTKSVSTLPGQIIMNVTSETFGVDGFYFEFTLSACRNSLTGLYLQLNGANSVYIPSNCFGNSYNSSHQLSGCPIIAIQPCNHYNIEIIPEFNGHNKGKTVAINGTSLPRICEERVDFISSGGNGANTWFSFQMASSCQDLSSINVTLAASRAIFQSLEVPVDCLQSDLHGSYSFNSSRFECLNHLAILPLETCTNYSVVVDSRYETCGGSSQSFNFLTKTYSELPPAFVTEIRLDRTSMAIYLQLDSSCPSARTNLWLTMKTDSMASTTAVLLDRLDELADGSYVLNTTKCVPSIQLEACTEYQVSVQVEYFGTYNASASNVKTVTTLPIMQPVQISIVAEYGDRINFHWELGDRRCMKMLDGFLLSVKDNHTGLTESNMISRTCFDVVNDTVEFNTTDAHMNIRPCTDYLVEVMPRVANRTFFDMKGSVKTRTAADGNVSTFTQITAKDNWIYINGSLSSPECHKEVTKVSINITSADEQFVMSYQWEFGSNEAEKTFQMNVTWPEYDINPCSNYTIQLTPHMAHQSGTKSNVTAFTAPVNPVVEIDKKSMSAGVNWIAGELRVPDSNCQKALTSLQLILRANNQDSTINCLLTNSSGLAFNTSSICSPLAPCTNYTVQVVPVFFFNYTGLSTDTSIGTKSGKSSGAIQDLRVADRTNNSISLAFYDPPCANSTVLIKYMITITKYTEQGRTREKPNFFHVSPECKVNGSITISDSTCNLLDANLTACTDYEFKITPLYHLDSAYEEKNGKRINASTMPNPSDIKISNFRAGNGSEVVLKWETPKCAAKRDTHVYLTSGEGYMQNLTLLKDYGPAVPSNEMSLTLNPMTNLMCGSTSTVQIMSCYSQYNMCDLSEKLNVSLPCAVTIDNQVPCMAHPWIILSIGLCLALIGIAAIIRSRIDFNWCRKSSSNDTEQHALLNNGRTNTNEPRGSVTETEMGTVTSHSGMAPLSSNEGTAKC